MSLDTVVEDIREEAERRAEEILAEAEDEAAEIRSEAEDEAAEIRSEAEREVEAEIEREREQRLSSGKLAAKQERLEARRDVLATVRERVEAEIGSLEAAKRETLTRELLAAGAAEFDAADVYARPEDQALLEDLLEEYDGFELAGETDCLGGVLLEGPDGRLRVDNTFDSLLESVWEDNLKALSDVLFEEQ
jgi:V/A-type H+-transporting ATPase subunit E